MDRIPRWTELPGLFRLLLASFGGADVVGIAIAAVGWRGWDHAVMAVLISVAFLLLLYPLCAPAPTQEPWTSRSRFPGVVGIVAGAFLLFVSVWAIAGFVDQTLKGEVSDRVVEGIVFIMALFATGALMLRWGLRKKRVALGAPST